MKYDKLPHIDCGGTLTWEIDKITKVVLNKEAVRNGAVPKVKELNKAFYRCDKCNELVHVISCPSWEDYVLNGKIKVNDATYWAIRNARDKRYKQEELKRRKV